MTRYARALPQLVHLFRFKPLPADCGEASQVTTDFTHYSEGVSGDRADETGRIGGANPIRGMTPAGEPDFETADPPAVP